MNTLPTGFGVNAHIAVNLLPEWLGAAWTAIFLLIAASHLRHTAHTSGQRRAWHISHVLIGIGMAFMYTPAAIDPLQVPTTFWRLVFASAGLLAALWALGGAGRVPTLIWLFTSMDLGVMVYMWAGSAHSTAPLVTWSLVVYLVVCSALWTLDIYRRLDGTTPLFSLQIAAGHHSGGAAITSNTAASASLIGELDINASMIAMTLGMAYMLVAVVG
jgi:hypothetical protein